MRSLAMSQGVPASAIVLESRASSTFENVVFVYALLEEHESDTILLVSSPYHMRRALLTWEAQAPDVKVIPTPVRDSQFYNHVQGASLEQLKGLGMSMPLSCGIDGRGGSDVRYLRRNSL